jgi:hypothetical protein
LGLAPATFRLVASVSTNYATACLSFYVRTEGFRFLPKSTHSSETAALKYCLSLVSSRLSSSGLRNSKKPYFEKRGSLILRTEINLSRAFPPTSRSLLPPSVSREIDLRARTPVCGPRATDSERGEPADEGCVSDVSSASRVLTWLILRQHILPNRS